MQQRPILPWFEPEVPTRLWRPFDACSWENYMPQPRGQLSELLPRDPRGESRWVGSCAVHTYYEAFTARLQMKCEEWYGVHLTGLRAHLPGMILCSAGHGVLDHEGAYSKHIGLVALYHGIPLEGNVSVAALLQLEPHQRPWALGTSVERSFGVPLPYEMCELESNLAYKFHYEAISAAMDYREDLCACIDRGPVVVALHLQSHYCGERLPDVPYQRNPEEVAGSFGHAITVYAYACPGGDVRTLILYYQDNMTDFVGRYTIHPDAIEVYFEPTLDNLEFSPRPRQGHHFLYPGPMAKPPFFWSALDYIAGMQRSSGMLLSPIYNECVADWWVDLTLALTVQKYGFFM